MAVTLGVWDGNYYLNRALHTFPSMNTKGVELGAASGALTMICSDLQKFKVTNPVVVFDYVGKNFRHKISANYKENKLIDSDHISVYKQSLFLYQLLRFIGIQAVMVKGVEGDDTIASIVAQRQLVPDLSTTLIFTGDKDMQCLVRKDVKTIDTRHKPEPWVGTKESVYEKYGVYPNRIRDYLALMGDKNDGISGLPKCGPKTAIQLLEHFGSIKEMLQATDLGKWEKLLTPTNLVNLRRDVKLATVKKDIPMDKFAPYALHKPMPEAIRKSMELLGKSKYPSFVVNIIAKEQYARKSLFTKESLNITPLDDDSAWDGLVSALTAVKLKSINASLTPTSLKDLK